MPIASFLVANREAYFNDLNGYRSGHIASLVTRFASAAEIASVEATRTATTLDALPALWKKKLGTVRSGGVTSELLHILISKSVFIADEMIGVIARNPTSIYNAISKLNSVEILAPLSDKKRNQIWGAVDVLQELDDLDHRIAAKGRA